MIFAEFDANVQLSSTDCSHWLYSLVPRKDAWGAAIIVMSSPVYTFLILLPPKLMIAYTIETGEITKVASMTHANLIRSTRYLA